MRHWSSLLLPIVAVSMSASNMKGEEKREPLPEPVAPPGTLRFSFGPIDFKGLEAIPTMRDGFAPVHVTTGYAKDRGFGWLGAEGEVERGWLEQRGRLSSRARRGPNDLLAGWIAGGLPFDSNQLNAFGSLAFPGLVPTLALEESRAGIDDLRYVRTLQRVVAELRQHREPLVAARAQVAQEALDYWTDQVPERLSAASASDGAGSDTGLDFPPESLAQFRQEMAYHLCRLLRVDCPSVCPPEAILASWEEGEQTGWTSKIKPAAEHATHGEMAGKMAFNREGTYFDTWGRLRVKDWRGFTSFRFDLFNPQTRDVELVLTLRDQLAANVTTELSARKTITLRVTPGVNPIVVPLASLVDDGGKRPLDLSCVFNLYFSVKAPAEEVTLYIDNMRLVENQ